MFVRDYEALVKGDYVFVRDEDGSQPAEFDAIHERDLALNEKGLRVTVFKLHDKEVGQRVARFMLEAFGRV